MQIIVGRAEPKFVFCEYFHPALTSFFLKEIKVLDGTHHLDGTLNPPGPFDCVLLESALLSTGPSVLNTRYLLFI